MTRQQAINKFCKDCIYDPYSQGNWRQQIEECTASQCALFEYRPITIAGRNRKRDRMCAEDPENYAKYRQKYAELARKNFNLG